MNNGQNWTTVVFQERGRGEGRGGGELRGGDEYLVPGMVQQYSYWGDEYELGGFRNFELESDLGLPIIY